MNQFDKRTEEVKRHYGATPFDFQEMRGRIFKASLTHDILQRYDLSHKQIVDVGCSTSFLGEFLRTNYPDYRYLGIDINPKAVEIARVSGLNVRQGNNLCLDLPDNFSDLTVSEGVIHHTPDPLRCFRELIRVTKRGGLISIYIYNRHHMYYFIYKGGFIVRSLSHHTVGRKLVKRIVFPLFTLFYVEPGRRLYFKDAGNISGEVAWNIFNDQILTPVAQFFTRDEVLTFAEAHGLSLIGEKLSINKQGLMFAFRKL